jgi:precorrin-2 dehydrogenase / sirohydrochlorin ferrochelatase
MDHTPATPAPVGVYPVGLLVAGRKCLVVGGGIVAARKVAGLLACGATVTVVAPEVHEAIASLTADGILGAITGDPLDVHLRPYRAGEAAGYRFVVSATGVPEVDSAVHRDAEAAGVWVNSADDPAHCSAILPAVLRRGMVSVAVSTSGSSPALASWIRDRLSASLGPELDELARILGEGRAALVADGRSTASVDWRALLDGDLPDLVATGRLEEARALVDGAIRGERNP